MSLFSDILDARAPKDAVQDDTIGTSLRRGWDSGLSGAQSQLHSVAGMAGELVGADDFAKASHARARGLRDQAALEAPQISQWGQVDGVGNLLRYGAGIVGGSAPVSLAAMGAGALTGGGAIPAMAAAGAVTAPFEIGDVIQKQQADPEAMQLPAGERAMGALAGGLGSAAFQGVVPGLVGKQLGHGTAGAAKQSLKGMYGRNVLGDAVLEAGAEGGGEAIKQLGANSNAPLDWDAIKENAIGGAIGGGAMGHIGLAGDLAHNVAPQAREMFDSAKTSISDRMSAAKGKVGETADAVGESVPGKKIKSAWDDVSELVQRGREKIDDTVDKVLNGEELGVNPMEWARATTDEAKRRLTELSDNEHVKAATKWADEMLADKGLDAAKRSEIVEAAGNIKERAGQVAMAGFKKAWDLGKAGKSMVDSFVNQVKEGYEAGKRADVDVESSWMDEPTPELVALGYAHKKAPEAAEAPAGTPTPPEPKKASLKDRKAFIDDAVAQGMSKEEARTAYIESLNDSTKKSEDYSGANAAVAKAIQESGIVSKRPDLFGSNESINKMADALRVVAEQANKGKLSEKAIDAMIDVFGKDAPRMVSVIDRALNGTNLDPAKTDKVFQSINDLNRASKIRGDLHGFLRESMTEDALLSNLSIDLPKLADTLVKHARGELTAKATPAEAQAINEAMAGVLEDHFGPNAAAVSKRIEEAAKQYGEPNMDRSGGAEFGEEVLTDENGAEIESSEGGFDESGNRLDAAEQDITRYGLSKANVSGHQRNVINGAMMHKDSQYVEKYMQALKDRHSTKDDEGRVVSTHEGNGYDIRFEKAEGSEFGHIVVEKLNNPNEFNDDDLSKMKLDTKRYPKSPSRVEVGSKVNAKEETVPLHILDAKKIARLMRDKSQQRIDRGTSSTARQRLADGFAQGLALLTEKYGSAEHPIAVDDAAVIGHINGAPVTWGEARKVDPRTSDDVKRDANARRQEELRAEFAKAKGIPTKDPRMKQVHNQLIRAFVKAREAAGGDETKVPERLMEYISLIRTHAKVLTSELAGGRDTQEASRLPASTTAPRTNKDKAVGATYTDNNLFTSETSARKDADKSGNIHEAAAGLSAEALIHRSNMDGSGHWAGNDHGVDGLTTLIGTVTAEWSKTPGAPAKKVLARVKKLIAISASMSKADAQKLRMLAPDPMKNPKGGPVDYNDRYTANDTLDENLRKMNEKQAVKELTRRENLFDELGNKRSEFARIIRDEIGLLEAYIDTGEFGSGAGIQDSLTLGEATPVINELARKYADVVVAPGEKAASVEVPGATDKLNRAGFGTMKKRVTPTNAKPDSSIPTNPIKFKGGEATNGIKPVVEAKTETDEGYWTRRDGKHIWVEGTKSPKAQAPAKGASAKSGETKQSAQSTNPNVNNAQTYNAQDVRDHIEKVLAKSVKMSWATFTHAGQFDRTQAGDFIRLSVHALDPMSTAYHESLHAFFAQLRDAGATDIIDVVQKAAASQHVIDQLNERFKNEPAVLQQLKDPEERAAYMYQMWAADPKGFKVSIAARTTFEKIKAFIRKVLGTWTNDERALHIMSYFHEGQYARDMGSPSAVRHALMDTHKSQILETAKGFTEPLGHLADAVVGVGSERLRNTGIPALNELADIIKRDDIKEGGDQGFIQASRIAATKLRTELGKILGGLDAAQTREVMDALQTATPATSPEARLVVREVKDFLRSTHKYMKEAGVNLGDLGADYFPRVWDTHYIGQNQQAFRAMLEPYIRRGEMKGTADSLISRLISHDGSELGIGADLREATQPGMQHTKERMLAFITPADAAQFVQKDLFATLGSYVNQAARKAEWSRRVGKGKMEQLIADAKAQGATKAHLDLAEQYMKGVDGTLGDGMDPTARRLVGNMIVYQNVRLLPMAAFSMLIDPLGVMVRGGTVADAWGTFKRGVKGITQTFSKNAGEANDKGTKWAELVGAVDTAMMSHVMGDIYSQGMVGGQAQKINNAFFKYNLVEGLNRNFRIGAVEAAVRFLARHAGGLDGLGSSLHSKRWMRELGLEKGDVQMVGGRIAMTEADGLTSAQVVRVHAAINQWVDGAVLRPNAADKPIWMNDPHWALIAHLKQFVFTFQKVILGRVMHEMNNGNYAPMMALASYVPVMIAADTAKGLLQGGGDTPEWKKGWGVSDYVGYGVQRAGLFGVGQFGIDVVSDVQRGGIGAGALSGPTIEQFTDVMQTLGGRKTVGSTVVDALPANAVYKEILTNDSASEPMFTS